MKCTEIPKFPFYMAEGSFSWYKYICFINTRGFLLTGVWKKKVYADVDSEYRFPFCNTRRENLKYLVGLILPLMRLWND